MSIISINPSNGQQIKVYPEHTTEEVMQNGTGGIACLTLL
jgi:hypothetical protein